MPSLSDVAFQHQDARIRLAQLTANRVRRVWSRADIQNLDASWDALAPNITQLITAGQVAAARQAEPYLARVERVTGFDAEPAKLVPEAFGGVMLDGREVGPAAFGAVTTTKRAIGAGYALPSAFESGMAFLGLIAKAAIADMGRQADNTLAVGKGWTHYIRVVNPGACSRCAILAGKSSYKTAFKRHPGCKCTAVPDAVDTARDYGKGLMSSPEEYFENLTRAEQDRIFTRAGAEAIRNGANPISVVNARRGALTGGGLGRPARLIPTTIGVRADGTPLRVFLTGEGTTARGAFGARELRLTGEYAKTGRYRRTTTVRLMPEQIQVMAGGNPERWRELLQKYGYLY